MEQVNINDLKLYIILKDPNIKNRQMVPPPLLAETYDVYKVFEKYNVKINYDMPPTILGDVLRKNSRFHYINKLIETQYKEIKLTHNKP